MATSEIVDIPGMTAVLRRLHIYVGLFNLTVLIVFAATGVAVTFPADDGLPQELRSIAYRPPSHFTDKEVADDLFAKLALPVAAPIPAWAISRNEENVLALTFYSPNGVYIATVREEQNTVTLTHSRGSFGAFMNAMHSTTLFAAGPDLRLTLWAAYIDLSIFSLLFMAFSGVWLWLTSRPRVWWAGAAFALGTGIFGVLWIVTR